MEINDVVNKCSFFIKIQVTHKIRKTRSGK